MMHVRFVIPYFAPAWAYGGPPRVAYDMARQLVNRGHVVDVLTTDALGQANRLPSGWARLDGIRVHRDRNISNRLAWRYKIFLPREFGKSVWDGLRTVDIVHLFDFRTYQNAVTVATLRQTRIRYVLSAFGELPRATGGKRPLKALYDALFGYRILHGAARLVAQTADEADWYRRFGARVQQVCILPLAVDFDEISVPPSRGHFRASLGISPSERVVLFLGRIHEYKGLELLVRAFANVRQSRHDVRLVIAGRDDGYLTILHALARQLAPADSILFPGPVYGAERFTAYADANLFAITPSHAEQTSLAALEAGACGTPALVSTNAPIPGLDEAGAGVTVPYDQARIEQALARLLDGSNLEAMGERARDLAQSNFSLARVAARLEALYADIARQ